MGKRAAIKEPFDEKRGPRQLICFFVFFVLQTVHGPSELVGERLELCARQHYARGYQFVRFLSCRA